METQSAEDDVGLISNDINQICSLGPLPTTQDEIRTDRFSSVSSVRLHFFFCKNRKTLGYVKYTRKESSAHADPNVLTKRGYFSVIEYMSIQLFSTPMSMRC